MTTHVLQDVYLNIDNDTAQAECNCGWRGSLEHSEDGAYDSFLQHQAEEEYIDNLDEAAYA